MFYSNAVPIPPSMDLGKHTWPSMFPLSKEFNTSGSELKVVPISPIKGTVTTAGLYTGFRFDGIMTLARGDSIIVLGRRVGLIPLVFFDVL